MPARHPPDALVRSFVAKSTGCGFAAMFANDQDGMLWATFHNPIGDGVADEASDVLDDAAKESKAAAIVFPLLRTASDVAELLRLLNTSERWTVSDRWWKNEHPTRGGDSLFLLRWRTPAGEDSSVLGLAPFGEMPIHRRAPLVTLVVWPGRRENVHRGAGKAKWVGLVDMKLPDKIDKAAHDTMWNTAVADVAEIRGHAPEGAARYDVSFCLPSAVRSIIFPDHVMA